MTINTTYKQAHFKSCSITTNETHQWCLKFSPRKGSKKRKRLPAIVDSNWAKLSKTIGAAVKSVPAPPPKPAGDKPPHSKHTLTHSEYIKAPVPPELMNSGRNPAAIVSKYLGLDCEMVGVGPEDRSALAEISIINFEGDLVYHRYVKPQERVTDFRTKYSGIRPKHLDKAAPFSQVQKEVSDLTKDRILVGHALSNDLEVLMLSHPRSCIRDTARYKPLCRLPKSGAGKAHSRKLRDLTKEVLGVEIQSGEHSPVEDARAAMLLYRIHSKDWEAALRKAHPHKAKVVNAKAKVAVRTSKKNVVVGASASIIEGADVSPGFGSGDDSDDDDSDDDE